MFSCSINMLRSCILDEVLFCLLIFLAYIYSRFGLLVLLAWKFITVRIIVARFHGLHMGHSESLAIWKNMKGAQMNSGNVEYMCLRVNLFYDT